MTKRQFGKPRAGNDGRRWRQIAFSAAHIEIAAIDRLAERADQTRSEWLWRQIVAIPEVKGEITRLWAEGFEEPPLPPLPGTPEYYASW